MENTNGVNPLYFLNKDCRTKEDQDLLEGWVRQRSAHDEYVRMYTQRILAMHHYYMGFEDKFFFLDLFLAEEARDALMIRLDALGTGS